MINVDTTGKLKKLVALYKEKGYTDEQIDKIWKRIVDEASEQLVAIAMRSLTEADLNRLDETKDETLFQEEMMRLYQLRTNQDPNEHMVLLIDKLAQKQLEQEKSQTPSSS